MTNKEITDKLNEITQEYNGILGDLLYDLKKERDRRKEENFMRDKSKVIRTPKVADIMSKVPNINEAERDLAKSILKEIRTEIEQNPAKYGHINIIDRGDDKGSKESGAGTGEVELVYVGRPQWLDFIESGVKKVFKRKMKREWFDVEALTYGRILKQRESGVTKKNYMFMLLDVSGSMGSYSYKGIPLVKLFASYLPAMVKQFAGSFIEVDGDKINETPFKTLSTQNFRDKINKGSFKIALTGGGGAQFNMAMNYINDKIKKENITEPAIIIATDGHEDFKFEIPKNTFFITTPNGTNAYGYRQLQDYNPGFPNKDLGQYTIEIDIDSI